MDPRDLGRPAPDADPGGVDDLGVGTPRDDAPERSHDSPVGRPDVRVAAGVVAALLVLVVAIVIVLLVV